MDLSHEARMERLAQLRVAREALRRREPERFNGILRILTEADLIGICDDDARSGERYAAIVGTLLPRLADGMAAPAIQALVFEEMTAWFNTPPGGSVVGAPERYALVAERIAGLWAGGARRG